MIAFGAVATGNMKAQLALMVAGTIILIGSMPIADETENRIGMIMAVVAVLLVISVKKVMAKQMLKIMKNTWTPLRNKS